PTPAPTLFPYTTLFRSLGLCRSAWHRRGRGSEARASAARSDGPLAARHPRASRAQPSDLCAHLRLWPLRPAAGRGWRLLLGKDRSEEHTSELQSLTNLV